MQESGKGGFFEQKFEQWNKKLLDLSKKNHLLNFKPRKTGTFELSKEGEIETLFTDLMEGEGYLFEVMTTSSSNEENKKIKDRTRKLDYIRKQIKQADDELGFNIGYVAFGLLCWKENDNHSKEFQSPLILVPIQIKRENLKSPIQISRKEDEEISFNPVILKKLFDDFGIEIDEKYEFKNISESLSYIESCIIGFDWSISRQVFIDTFNFQNLVIQKDLENNKEMIRNNPFIKAISGVKDEVVGKLFDEYNEEIDLKSESSKSRLQILDADSSQQEAISRARRGDSFVLQGPPGTGKSQTISNIIAEQLGLGKKILFVSEKQAALEVVYQKLKEKGLADFLLTLHNTKQKKSDIREQLEQVYNLSSNPHKFREEDSSRYELLDKKVHELNSYTELVHSQENSTGKSFYELHAKLSKVLLEDDLLFSVDKKLLSLKYEKMEVLFQKIHELGKMYITSTFRHKDNGWKNFKG
ncbi:Part of AAA domain-containing protein [Pilibacter termitis]|uniref:Part of AAA domain-containing protein n=1 Tax=Pilibacter termitis TaxID=263852 RepID=A0A1T4MZJ5_9ENTE|nr:DUF4011 domain-containing protein [Pilibacter termitis]SJZ72479.1 Part of AAA domain-containing protein [Pilibacter termitis]